jgi:hypothetical protein
MPFSTPDVADPGTLGNGTSFRTFPDAPEAKR